MLNNSDISNVLFTRLRVLVYVFLILSFSGRNIAVKYLWRLPHVIIYKILCNLENKIKFINKEE